jgi:hypothetical protein
MFIAVTIFQHSPITRRVFYNIIKREREETLTTYGTLNDISINNWKFLSSSIISSFTIWSSNGIIIIVHSMKLEPKTSTSVRIKEIKIASLISSSTT